MLAKIRNLKRKASPENSKKHARLDIGNGCWDGRGDGFRVYERPAAESTADGIEWEDLCKAGRRHAASEKRRWKTQP